MEEQLDIANVEPRRNTWPSAVAVIVCAFLICGSVALISYKFLASAGHTVDRVLNYPKAVASAVKDLFGTHVTIQSTSVSLDTEQITELALIQRKTLCYTKWEVKSLGGYAVLIIRGEFIAKAGYDLQKAKIQFDESKRLVTIDLPSAKLLSFETVSQSSYYKEDDPRRRIQSDDVLQAEAENSTTARREAVEFGIGDEAESRMQQRIKDIFRGVADHVVLNGKSVAVPESSGSLN